MIETTLDKVPIGKTVIIKDISVNSPCRLRFLDIGITPKAQITPLFKSPMNDPVAYLVEGAVISLRSKETSMIKVFLF